MREDSFVSSTGPDQYSETAIFSGSDSENQGPATPSQDQPLDSVLSDSEPPPTPLELPSSDENHINYPPPEVCNSTASELHPDTDVLSTVCEPAESAEEVHTTGVQQSTEPVQEEKEPETSEKSTSEPSAHQGVRRSTSNVSRQLSTDSLPVSIFTDKKLLVENNTHR